MFAVMLTFPGLSFLAMPIVGVLSLVGLIVLAREYRHTPVVRTGVMFAVALLLCGAMAYAKATTQVEVPDYCRACTGWWCWAWFCW